MGRWTRGFAALVVAIAGVSAGGVAAASDVVVVPPEQTVFVQKYKSPTSACADSMSERIVFGDAGTGAVASVWVTHQNACFGSFASPRLSPDRRELIVNNANGNSSIVNLTTRASRGLMISCPDSKWSPDGRMFACARSNGTIRVYDAQTLVEVTDCCSTTNMTTGFTTTAGYTWLPNSRQIMVTYSGGSECPSGPPRAQTYLVGAGAAPKLLFGDGCANAVIGPELSPDGSVLAGRVQGESTVALYDFPTGTARHRVVPPAPFAVSSYAFTLDGRSLLLGLTATNGSGDQRFAVADVATGVVRLTAASGNAQSGFAPRNPTSGNVDTTPPVITESRSGSGGAGAWYIGPVTLSYSCSDVEHVVTSCPAPRLLSDDGRHEVTVAAEDAALNVASLTSHVWIDQTPPALAATLAPEPRNGWFNTDVRVAFTCNDDMSGVAVCPADVVLMGEGANIEYAATAVDAAGNQTATSGSVGIDRTAPTIDATVTGPAGSYGYYTDAVTVAFECADALSGLVSCPEPVVVTADGQDQTVTRTAEDRAGNQSAVTVTVHVDATAPTIVAVVSGQRGDNGWYTSDVSVEFTCNDATSGIAACPASFVLGDGAGQVVHGRATDRAGNVTDVAVGPLDIDMSPPVISAATSGTRGANGWFISEATVRFTCTDTGSGTAECPADSMLGDGRHVVSATVVDRAGNSSTVVVAVDVDTTLPDVAITTAEGSLVRRGAEVAGSAADLGSGVTSVHVRFTDVGGNSYNVTATTTCASTGLCTWRSAVPAGVRGAATVTAEASDVAGLRRTSPPRRVVIAPL